MFKFSASFSNIYKAEVQKRLAPIDNISILNETDIQHLPEPVQKYLRYTGAIGKPNIYNFRVAFTGGMKRKIVGKWMDITYEQYNFYSDYAHVFVNC